MKSRLPNIVVLGGGTGTFTVLSGLKKYPLDLTAVVTMADDGGSTGVLRDELGVLPPGDVRQCLVALSTSDKLMRELMNYRFTGGKLKGHSFGNLLLSALEKATGSFDTAVEKASDILRTRGRVVPSTLDRIHLVAHLKNGSSIRGEDTINHKRIMNLKKITLTRRARPNPKAIAVLKNADLIVVGPGDIYTSIVPNLIVPGIREAIQKSRAKKVYVVNLMTKSGHTEGFSVHDHTAAVEQYLGTKFDYVVYNTKLPPAKLIRRYARKGENLVAIDKYLPRGIYRGADLLSNHVQKTAPSDTVRRSLIRHNPDRLAALIVKLL